MRGSVVKTILLAGAVAGTLDLSGALIVYGVILHKASALMILKSIAAAAFGLRVLKTGGYDMALWGVIFHYLIAFFWATAYVLIYPHQLLMRTSRVASGVLYGVFVWVVMNRIVLPMTKLPMPRFHWDAALIGAAILVVCIGLPIAFITAGGYKSRTSPVPVDPLKEA